MAKIKILFYGDSPTCATGFGQVSKNVLRQLYDTNKYDISIIGINHGGDYYDQVTYPYKIYPATCYLEGQQGADVYGRPRLINQLQSGEYDILFMLQDTFIVESFIDKILEVRSKLPLDRQFVIVYYYPIDGTPKKSWIETVAKVDFPVTYTEYAKAESYKALGSVFPLEVINHGYNPKDFKVVNSEEVQLFRNQNFSYTKESPYDHTKDFFILNVNRNQPRKDLYRSLAAFKLFHDKVPESFYFLNCQAQDVGGNIQEIASNIGLELYKDYSFPSTNVFNANQGLPIQIVNMFYNVADLVISSTIGEGWGLCLWPETNLYTENGIKKIKDISVFDKVLSSNGEYNNVEAIMSREYNDDLYEITTWLSNIPIKSSAEHGFKVYDNGNFIWKKASELEIGDNLVYPSKYAFSNIYNINILDFIKPYLTVRQLKNIVIKNNKFKIQSSFKKEQEKEIPISIIIDKDFCKLIGLFLAEGSINTRKLDRISFSFNKNEIEELSFVSNYIKEKFGVEVRVEKDNRKNYQGQTITFYSTVLAKLFSLLCGCGARNKKIHPMLLNLDKECLLQITYGMFIGDGSYSNTTFEFSICTISPNIAYGLKLLYARLGILSSIRTSRTEYKVNVSGVSKTKLLSMYNINYEEINKSKATERAFIIEDFQLFPIKKIEKNKYIGKLVDIQVANTNDFVAENVIVHNSSVEAMATKTPVLFPHNTSLIEIIGENEERGYHCKSGEDLDHRVCLGGQDNNLVRPLVDVNHMADKMLYIYEHYDEAKAKTIKAYEWAKSWEQVCKQWKEVFRNAEKKLIEIRK